jgi:hypothetical protein
VASWVVCGELNSGAYAELERGHLMVGINVGYRAGAVRGPGWRVHVCLGRT